MLRLFALILIGIALSGASAAAGEVTAAVASNFLSTFRSLTVAFEQTTGHRVRIVSGSTGKLFAQIVHGAPYEVFLSADTKRPRLLEERGLAESRFTYALGKITLWSADPNLIGHSGEDILKRGTFRHLALANPKTAPYGLAAKTVLQKLKLWSQLQPRIVQGENISQALQFIASRNAELGFVAVAQVLDPKLRLTGSRWDIPETLYDPIRQDAVLLKRGRDNPAARALMKFLQGSKAHATIQRYGYGLSTEAP